MSLEDKYTPNEIEDIIYKNWEEKGYFTPTIDKSKKPYTIVIPPPNITGKLHMGHALDNTLQDILIRFNRLKKVPTLWLPGTDHASIATELKVSEKIEKEQGKTKKEIGREEFLKEAWAWKEKYSGDIINQLKKLGASCDFTRERFTLDAGLTKAVETVFVNLYNKGLIYKGERIINWCTSCKTSISDNEVEFEEENSNLWHISYKIENSNKEIVVATTRPETMLGDTAIAVNPNDSRFKKFIGKYAIVPIVGRKVKIVADEYVEKDFGTGAVKITPAHDPNDYEIGLRHNLDVINIITQDGHITSDYGKFSGLSMFEARIKIVKELEKIGALVKTEEYTHNVGRCYRCKTVVEPYASSQWFVKMKSLALPAIEAVKENKVRFIPERFEKTYMNWMENIKDWCISRQLWWGHRIPAYYCDKCNKMIVTTNPVKTCECKGTYKQDEDVLDTWFSSALWPFSTLGWPDKTEDLEYFYPTSTLVTGYDIITFWVSKMIFSGIEHTKTVPFKDVFLHGLVRDSYGRKMSKSLGNGIDPLEIISKYGADSLRLSLVQNITPGNDIRYTKEKVEASRNFINKLYNAAKFTKMSLDKSKDVKDIINIKDIELNIEDKWILTKFSKVNIAVTNNIENYEIGVALSYLYDFVWSDLCDSYIEMIKPRLYKAEKVEQGNSVAVLRYILLETVKLLHPFIPFITEKIYLELKEEEDIESIIISKWPNDRFNYQEDEKIIDEILDIIKQIRNLKAIENVVNSKKIKLHMITDKYYLQLQSLSDIIIKMVNCETLKIQKEKTEESKDNIIHSENIAVIIDLNIAVSKQEKLQKLKGQKEFATKELLRANKLLANKNFISKAPKDLINKEKEKVIKYEDIIKKIDESLLEK